MLEPTLISSPRRRRPIGNATAARILCLTGILLAGCAARAAGQAAPEGRVSGHVRGPGDIAVPGAKVTLVDTLTGERKATWTDEAGNYTLAGIKPGTYKLQVSLVGFRTDVREPVPVTDGRSLRVNVALVLALPETATEVRRGRLAGPAGSSNLASVSPRAQGGLGDVGGQTEGLPAMPGSTGGGLGVNGATDLRFSEGAAEASTGQQGQQGENAGGEGEISAADAGSSSANSFLLSGSVGEAPTPGEGRGGRGQGFRNGQGQGGAPGFGGGGGGFGGGGGGGFGGGGGGFGGGGFFGGGRRPQVNRLRGSLFEDFSNSAFNARPYPLNPEVAGSPQIFYYSDRFGATIGGPLSIPKIYPNGKDKTSFFVNYQLQRARSPFSNFATVPTLTERQGDFSDAVVNGVVPTIYNPRSNPLNPDARTPFAPSPCGSSVPCPGNIIPGNLINKAATGLMAYIPLPNLASSVQSAQGCAGGVAGAACVPYNFYLNESLPSDNEHLMVRIGHQISSKDNVYAFYNYVSSQAASVSSFPELTSTASTRQQSLNLGEVHNFAPRFFNNFTLNFTRSRTLTLNPFAHKEDIASNLGIQGVSQDPFDWGLPIISFTNYSRLNDTIPSLNRNQTLRAVDFVIWNRGKHNVRFGGEVRRIEQNSLTDPDARGTFNFTGYTTSGFNKGQPEKNTGLDFADFLL
ncbi:MAG TPA: carboxypeptidase-like regulatory domain-containing protein, partial [Terriglobia bacterium]|nr:carboxypeptidase-like regulatory domain-containing protein [Terriglobia bacterium]